MTAVLLAPVDGLVEVRSPLGQPETIARALASLEQHGVPLVARIDHAAAARTAGIALPPTELLIFGDPRAGTPLMCAERSVAIDLPLKLLVQSDSDGRVHLLYNDPAWIARRHRLSSDEPDRLIQTMQELLAAIVRDAIGPTRQ